MTERLNRKKYFKVKIGQKCYCLVLIVVGKICLIEELTPEPWGHDFSVKLPLSVSPYLLWDLSAGPLYWEPGVLATGLPGKSLVAF